MNFNKIDKEHIWHPYDSALGYYDCFLVEKAEGSRIQINSGEWLIDGMSSWWSVIHGYNHPVLNEAIHNQSKKVSHVMFGGLTHEPAISLAEALLDIVPEGLNHIFYCDSGSVSVEVAMKMALQYWHARGSKNKTKFLALKGGYHGDTWHAMSVCDPEMGMHHIYKEQLPKQFFVSRPVSTFYGSYNPEDLVEVKRVLENNHENIAAFILEPIAQGAGGMWFYHPQFLKDVAYLCKTYNVLLIADEIATGFGRTGKLFACDHAGISPDIMCLGKAITGGYMSFAVTLCTKKIAQTISEQEPGVLMHGPTFMGNPLACSVAKASISLLQNTNWQTLVKQIEEYFKIHLLPMKELSFVKETRVLGAIGVLELHEPVNSKMFQKKLVQNGIWVRPFGKLVYLMPPFTITIDQLNQLLKGIKKILLELDKK